MPRKKTVKKGDADHVQPLINVGLVGHVDHGKTTLTAALSGKWTDTHSEELKRGITIRLGYANASIYKCPKCPEPDAFTTEKKCPKCSSETQFIRKVSFVDAPGHESLMATMLAGATIMDGALLLIAANEECPQPQTREHVQALEIIGIKNVIVIQNKIDLVDEEKAKNNFNQIKEYLSKTPFKDAPIIPVSAQYKLNIDVLLQAIEEYLPTPERDESKTPIMFIARSFDVNKPGSEIPGLVGGVLGGSLRQGIFKDDDEIEIRPGYETIEKNQKIWKPLMSKIVGLMTGTEKVEEVHPGGSVALLTQLDPSIVKSDSLSGHIVGKPGTLFPVWYTLKLENHLLERVVGSKEDLQVEAIKKEEILMLNVNSAATVGVVTELGKNVFTCRLKRPICAEVGAKVSISRMIGSRFRLIGFGMIKQ
ncbi:translation initiation factor IF-2 subunit gamma [Candidatus Woesearchaeota archaeon]|nr:translation initiation factor IF-2 subunit gamma [Candidatus Woesearchaeota archaeon]